MSDFNDKAATWDDDPMKRERAGTIAAGIRNFIPESNDMNGFEFGCGTGLVSFFLKNDLKQITLADTSEGMIDILKKKIKASGSESMTPLLIDLLNDPLPDEQFDLVYTSMTLHHISDTGAIINKLTSLLVSGGYLCIADLDSESGNFHDDDFSGHHGFDRNTLKQQLEDEGLTVVHVKTCFTITKDIGGVPANFPVFLMTAQK